MPVDFARAWEEDPFKLADKAAQKPLRWPETGVVTEWETKTTNFIFQDGQWVEAASLSGNFQAIFRKVDDA